MEINPGDIMEEDGLVGEAIGGSVHMVMDWERVEDRSDDGVDMETAAPTPSKPRLQTKAERILEVINQSSDNVTTPFFSIMICIWGALFLEIWKRKQHTFAYEWDVNNFDDVEPDRPQFIGTKKRKDPVTEMFTYIYPMSARMRKYFLSSFIVLFMIGVVFLSVSGVIVFKVFVKVKFNCAVGADGLTHPDRKPTLCFIFGTVTPTLLNAISVLIMSKIYGYIVEQLTDFENHRTQTEYNDALIIKIFAFHFANSYSSLFYLAFVRPDKHGFQNNGVFNMGVKYKDTCERGSCMTALSFQVFVLMIFKPIPKFFKDIVWPSVVRMYKRFRRLRKKTAQAIHPRRESHFGSESTMDDSHFHQRDYESFVEREYHKPKLGDFTLPEYTEKVLEFGYLVLFAASFPLAPLITVIVTLSDLRVDAKRLLWFNQRPIAYIASDIGMWYNILRFIVYFGVMTNAFIVGYTSGFVNKFHRLITGEGCKEVTAAERLIVVIVFEHVVAIIIYVINMIIPDVPSKVKLAQRKVTFFSFPDPHHTYLCH